MGVIPKQVFEWNGDKIVSQMRRAEVRGIGFVRAMAVRQAKQNHPGWRSRSKRAQRSIKALGRVHRDGSDFSAEWGSRLWYVLFLELDHGSFLRAAADATYHKLHAKIEEFYDKR